MMEWLTILPFPADVSHESTAKAAPDVSEASILEESLAEALVQLKFGEEGGTQPWERSPFFPWEMSSHDDIQSDVNIYVSRYKIPLVRFAINKWKTLGKGVVVADVSSECLKEEGKMNRANLRLMYLVWSEVANADEWSGIIPEEVHLAMSKEVKQPLVFCLFVNGAEYCDHGLDIYVPVIAFDYEGDDDEVDGEGDATTPTED